MTNSGPVALITGAAKRIGAAMAMKLHNEGYRVIIHYGHSENDAQSLAARLNQKRANSAFCLQADLCDTHAVSALGEQTPTVS